MRAVSIVLSFVMFLSGAALAAAGELDGTWTGATPGGSSIKVVVANDQAKSYYFKGKSQGVIGGKVTGGKAAFGLRTNKSAKVVLQRQKGNKLTFVYTDNTGPDALKVTLTKN